MVFWIDEESASDYEKGRSVTVRLKDGEVEASVFDRYRTPLYKEASYKPYIIAAMIFLAKVKDPQATLMALEERGIARWFQK